MQIILYNPLSAKNTGYQKYIKFTKKLRRKNIDYKGYSLLDIDGNEEVFLSSLNQEDIITIIGGDGTLSRVINQVKNLKIKNRIFFLKAGSGNDFARCYKKKYFEITEEFNNFPSFKYNDKTVKFINGIGMGIDALVAKQFLENSQNGIKESYYKIARKTFKTFEPFNIKLTVDNNEYSFEKVWFVVVQNGKYFGGGMKVAPKAKRLDGELDIIVVHKMKLWKLLLLFPTIFIGCHTRFKKSIFSLRGKDITLETFGINTLQHDGEIIINIDKVQVKA